jgi:Zn-dependent protease with chaperone function
MLLTAMTNLERILRVAQSDPRLQTAINANVTKTGCTSHLIFGYAFDEQSDDSPAFCLGIQIANYPIGVIFVGRRLARILTKEELDYVILHEVGHIVKNHFFQSALIWLAKSWIINIIADGLKVSRKKAIEYLDYAKILFIIFSRSKTIEESAKANTELEADKYAVTIQGQKVHAISTLLKLSNGNITMPTHVTADGAFSFPIVTYQERIEAINRI